MSLHGLQISLIHHKRLHRTLFLNLWLLLSAGILPAAEHHGIVKFGGLPVPGATVTATQGSTHFSVVTSRQGTYSFPNLPDGLWTIRVEMLCFAPLEKEIAVAPNAPAPEWNLNLLPLEQIQAAASAHGATALITKGGSSPSAPAAGSPAAPSSSAPAAKPQNASAGFRRTDVKATANPAALDTPSEPVTENASDSFLVNGSVNNGAASPFSQSAAFGNMRPGGRRRYNFGLSASLDNSALDARSFSLTGQQNSKPAYNRAQGGLSVGGPLAIPRFVSLRSYSYFFLAYQWVRNRTATTQSTLMPTSMERAGDLSETRNLSGELVRFIDPAGGAPFPNGKIPQSRIGPQARSLIGLYREPNFQGSTSYNYQVPIVDTSNSDAVQTRVMAKNFTGQFGWQRSSGRSPNVFSFVDTTRGSGINSNLAWSRRLARRAYLTARVEYSRSSTRATPYFANLRNVSGEAGIAGNNQDPENWGPPALSFSSGIAGLRDGEWSFTRNQTVGFSGAISWSHDSHTIKGGADIRRQQFNPLGQQNPRGTFGFTGASTALYSAGSAVSGTGSDLAGFLLGVPDTSAIAYGNADKYFRAGVYDAYINDDWRFRPGFSLSAGLRWEYGSPPTEIYGRLVNLDIAHGFAAASPVLAGSPTGSLTGTRYSDSLIRPDKHAFQPRVAIAWRPFAASSMLVRAGYGVYYDTSVYQSITNRMAQQSPLSKSLSVQNSSSDPLTLANGFKASPTTTANTFAVDPDFQVGYSQIWQLTVQRDLPGALVMSAGYLGNKGTRAQQQFLPNTYPTGAVNPCQSCPSGFIYLASNGNSTRHAAQVQLRRRLRAGFTGSVSYTFSKAIDNASLGGRGQETAVIAQDWLNLGGERGLSNFDQRHVMAAQVQYTTGMGVHGGGLLTGWKGAAFKGWTVATTVNAGSGTPLTPIYSAAVQGTGVTGSIRPDYTGASLKATPTGLYINPAAFTAPAAGHWGTAGRNFIVGPSQFSLNSSLDRTFGDNFLEFRIDATNLLNHVVYQSWNTNILSNQFGHPTAANAMRSIQTTLRVRF